MSTGRFLPACCERQESSDRDQVDDVPAGGGDVEPAGDANAGAVVGELEPAHVSGAVGVGPQPTGGHHRRPGDDDQLDEAHQRGGDYKHTAADGPGDDDAEQAPHDEGQRAGHQLGQAWRDLGGLDLGSLPVLDPGSAGPTRGQPLTADGIDTILRSARDRAGLAKVTCHQLRHTCLTRLREAGMELEAVQAQAGHASIESTRIYLHLTNDWLATEYRRAAERIDADAAAELRSMLEINR